MRETWTAALDLLEQDVYQLAKQAAMLPDDSLYERLNRERNVVEEYLGVFGVNHDRTLQIVRKSNPMVTRGGAAVFYWARQYLMKSKSLVDEFLALQSRKMWLRLLQARFSETKGEEPITLEAKHLVDLVQRRQQLIKIEDDLTEKLEYAAAKRKDLRAHYDSMRAADENWLAAGSMSARLGVNLRDAKDNPSAVGLKELMKSVSIPLRHPTERETLAKRSKDLNQKSEKLVELCSTIASQFVKGGHESVDKNSLNIFKEFIDQVEYLNRDSARRIQAMMKERIGPSKPKLVQSANKQATKVVE